MVALSARTGEGVQQLPAECNQEIVPKLRQRSPSAPGSPLKFLLRLFRQGKQCRTINKQYCFFNAITQHYLIPIVCQTILANRYFIVIRNEKTYSVFVQIIYRYFVSRNESTNHFISGISIILCIDCLVLS
jgi:hypothetical protein